MQLSLYYLPEFLQYQLQTYAMRIQIELPARSTSGVNNINSDEVKSLKIVFFESIQYSLKYLIQFQ